MKLPPGPPPNDPKKKKPAADEWDDALGDRQQQTISPDVVRKLLEMNPALREQGMNTGFAVNQAQKAHAQAATGQKGGASAAATQGEDIFAAFGGFKRELSVEYNRIDVEVARLPRERGELATLMREKVMRWIASNDPDMRSPVTQQVLEQEKAFLESLGFSVKDYVARRLKK